MHPDLLWIQTRLYNNIALRTQSRIYRAFEQAPMSQKNRTRALAALSISRIHSITNSRIQSFARRERAHG